MKTVNEIRLIVENDWMDSQGFITLNPASWSNPDEKIYDSENQILWTAIYYQFIDELGYLNASDIQHIISLIESVKVDEGIFHRHPGFDERIFSRDEQSAICILDNIINKYGKHKLATWAQGLCNHGVKTGWNYDNRPGKKWTIEGLRQYQDVAYFKLMAGNIPHPFEILWAGIALIFTFRKPPEATSSKLLWWYKIKSLAKRYPIFKPIKLLTHRQYKSQYGSNPIKAMFDIYFRQKEHPFHYLIKL